jgi:hypothetical protein
MSIPFSPLLKVAIVAGAFAGAAWAATEPSIETNFQLRPGESALIAGTHLEIGFDSVISDSRCAKGAACIWEGDASVGIWLSRSGGPREHRELHTASRRPRAASIEGYEIRLLGLTPYPVRSADAIAPSGYVATLRVSQGDDLEDVPR